MKADKKTFSSFKDKLQTRRLCEVGTRKDSRRSRVYVNQLASVLVRIS